MAAAAVVVALLLLLLLLLMLLQKVVGRIIIFLIMTEYLIKVKNQYVGYGIYEATKIGISDIEHRFCKISKFLSQIMAIAKRRQNVVFRLYVL